MHKYLPIIIVVVLAGAVSFYGGMKYAGSKNMAQTSRGDFQNFRAGATAGIGGRQGGRQMGGFMGGEIIAKDDKSVTIKLRDGGSKIVFFSGSTQVMKAVGGSIADLNVGSEITIMGDSNTDGSISAKSIQLRPPMPVNQ